MQKKETDKIQDFIQTFLQALDIRATIESTELAPEKTLLRIVAEHDQGSVIGKQGSTLEALQYIINVIARKENKGVQYRLDVNNYQTERDQLFLSRVSEYIVEKSESGEVLLWPMTPYERRLVHEYFLELGTHTTESENFGSKRVIRVVKK